MKTEHRDGELDPKAVVATSQAEAGPALPAATSSADMVANFKSMLANSKREHDNAPAKLEGTGEEAATTETTEQAAKTTNHGNAKKIVMLRPAAAQHCGLPNEAVEKERAPVLKRPAAASEADCGLPKGWRMEKRQRKSGASARVMDKYYISPDGTVHRSLVEVRNHNKKK